MIRGPERRPFLFLRQFKPNECRSRLSHRALESRNGGVHHTMLIADGKICVLMHSLNSDHLLGACNKSNSTQAWDFSLQQASKASSGSSQHHAACVDHNRSRFGLLVLRVLQCRSSKPCCTLQISRCVSRLHYAPGCLVTADEKEVWHSRVRKWPQRVAAVSSIFGFTLGFWNMEGLCSFVMHRKARRTSMHPYSTHSCIPKRV